MNETAFRHDAFVYDDDAEFVSALAPWLSEGVQHGALTVAVAPARICDLLREDLGSDSSHVSFTPNEEWYRTPMKTIGAWAALLRRVPETSPSARVIGEVPFGDTTEQRDSWIRYESALNRAFGTANAWAICPYDRRGLPGKIVRAAATTHPTVWDAHRRPSETFLPPEELFASLPPPNGAIADARPIALTIAGGLHSARHDLRDVCRNEGIADGQAEDLAIVVTELVTNAIRHGGGVRRAEIWCLPRSVVGEVEDAAGTLCDPLAGYTPPANQRAGGMGLWIARQLTDELTIERAPHGGTTVRFRVRR